MAQIFVAHGSHPLTSGAPAAQMECEHVPLVPELDDEELLVAAPLELAAPPPQVDGTHSIAAMPSALFTASQVVPAAHVEPLHVGAQYVSPANCPQTPPLQSALVTHGVHGAGLDPPAPLDPVVLPPEVVEPLDAVAPPAPAAWLPVLPHPESALATPATAHANPSEALRT